MRLFCIFAFERKPFILENSTCEMKKLVSVRTLVLFTAILFISVHMLEAQNRIQSRKAPATKREETKKAPINWKEKLWYGGNLGLGFSGNNFESVFLLGLAPMVGYKITPEFSIGPRVDFSYTYFGYNYTPAVNGRLNLFSYGIGPFARFRVFKSFFLHGEYQVESRAFPLQTGTGFTRVRDVQDNLFLGIGYNPGGSELMILYNFYSTRRSYLQPPFDFRFGFTYNF
jgi:hypothetical protein